MVSVLFVCLHGSAKSVIAASHFARLATAHGIEVSCGHAGLEPDEAIPSHVVEGLKSDGISLAETRPVQASPDLVSAADVVVSFACDVSVMDARHSAVRWDDLPAVNDGYAPARDAIVTRLLRLLDDVGRRQWSALG